MSAIRMYDAQQQAKQNAQKRASLDERYSDLQRSNKTELGYQNAAREAVAAQVLMPFEVAFRRIRHIDIAELERLDASDIAFSTPALAAVRLEAGASLAAMATSTAVGLGTSAVATAAVTAFATASTGAAISGLSGAAASSATLAWLGGGSLAAGGGGVAAGGVVLAGLTVAPALAVAGLFLHHQGNKQLRKQHDVASALKRTDGQLQTLAQQWSAIRGRSAAVREVLDRLTASASPRVRWLQRLVDTETDYRLYSDGHKADLAVVLALVTTTIAAMKADLFDEQLLVTQVSADVVAAANLQLDQLAPVGV